MIAFFFVGCCLLLLLNAFRVLKEYERGVVFMLGRYWKVKGPGLVVIVPILQQMVTVSLRTVVMDVPSQDVVSKDNIPVRVNAVVYFKVFDPKPAVIEVENYYQATSQLAQTTLRSVLGEYELDEMLAKREDLNHRIQSILDEQTDVWGIKVLNVEIKDIDLNESMIRALAKQAEAERDRRAKIIHAEGELQAAETLVKAAKQIEAASGAMQLRYLQTLTEVAAGQNNTIVLSIPEIISTLTNLSK